MARAAVPTPPVPLVAGAADSRQRETRSKYVFTTGPQGLRGAWSHWREQGTPEWLIVYTLAGAGRFGHQQGALTVRGGDIVLLRPGTRHAVGFAQASGRWNTLWAHFTPRPAWYDWLDWPEVFPGLMRLTLSEAAIRTKVVRAFKNVIRLTQGPFPRRQAMALNALEALLLWCDTANPRSTQARLDPRVRRALEYLCLRLAQPVTLGSLAAHTGLSRSRLCHLFHRQVGKTPQQFLEMERLNRACQLLQFTEETVSEIAQKVGYQNPFYFSLRFKRHTRLSPRAWRNRERGPTSNAAPPLSPGERVAGTPAG